MLGNFGSVCGTFSSHSHFLSVTAPPKRAAKSATRLPERGTDADDSEDGDDDAADDDDDDEAKEAGVDGNADDGDDETDDDAGETGDDENDDDAGAVADDAEADDRPSFDGGDECTGFGGTASIGCAEEDGKVAVAGDAETGAGGD